MIYIIIVNDDIEHHCDETPETAFMRISKAQAQENRERVVAAAAKLFREKGFDGVAVADLMRAAGLTHGGFYNHFDSKEELEAAACERVFQTSLAKIGAVADAPSPEARAEAFADYRRRYVSKAARDTPAPGCPMVAFAGDMSRRPPDLRAAYAKGLAGYLERFTRASGGDPNDASARAQALREFSTLAGALILARGVARDDPELSEEILRSAGGE
jgi:TetR/AcrR family transcriptional regulator, transcriptional repressor for nem operon